MGDPKTNVRYTVRKDSGYYKWNKGKNGNFYRTFYNQQGQEISQSAFLKKNDAVIDSKNSMRRKENIKPTKSNDDESIFSNPVGKDTAPLLNAEPVGEIKRKY